MTRKCNGCHKDFHISVVVGGQKYCACGDCIKKASVKFFNGDIPATIRFINAENWRRVSKAIKNSYEEGDE